MLENVVQLGMKSRQNCHRVALQACEYGQDDDLARVAFSA